MALLLDMGAEMEAVEPKHGNRPLHKAVENGNLVFASILLSRGAQVNARNNHDSTPLHIASRRASDEGGWRWSDCCWTAAQTWRPRMAWGRPLCSCRVHGHRRASHGDGVATWCPTTTAPVCLSLSSISAIKSS